MFFQFLKTKQNRKMLQDYLHYPRRTSSDWGILYRFCVREERQHAELKKKFLICLIVFVFVMLWPYIWRVGLSDLILDTNVLSD